MPIHEDSDLESSLARHSCRRGAVSIPWQQPHPRSVPAVEAICALPPSLLGSLGEKRRRRGGIRLLQSLRRQASNCVERHDRLTVHSRFSSPGASPT
jgi:hypothetical protein